MTVTILIGDVRDQLRTLPAEYFDCVVFSPPYWGLRDYGVAGQIGLEPTLGEHLAVMVDVMREVRRVLKKQGTVWLNYGDCYAAAPNGKSAAAYKAEGSDDRTFRDKPFSTVGPVYDPNYNHSPREHFVASDRQSRIKTAGRVVAGGYLKPKDLCMIPNRLAIALQDDGWWVRSEIIWHKPNPMPESVYDRPTSAHEKVWLLTKSEDYFYNHEAIREPVTGTAHARKAGPDSRVNVDRVHRSKKATRGRETYGRHTLDGAIPEDQRRTAVPTGWDQASGQHGKIHRAGRNDTASKQADESNPFVKYKPSFAAATRDLVETRNSRNVWTIAPKPFREAHFATFPPALAERCIKAGVPRDTCTLCGEARSAADCGGICASLPRAPGRVLDPFGGAGTVGLVADRLGLDCTLIELNPDYAEIARRRIYGEAPVAEAAE